MLGNISRKVSSKKQGAVMGVDNSMGSMAQIVGPLTGGFLLSYFIPGSVGILAALMATIGLFIMLKEDGKI